MRRTHNGKTEARVTDSVSDAGVITGPGSPNVLINNLPAARAGDMHTTPMVIPGSPPFALIGGPITGPGCPNVLINGLPAAVAGDLTLTAGPPGIIIMGSPNVLIGTGGAVGNSNPSAIEQTILQLRNSEIKPVCGSESFPVEVQTELIEVAKLLPGNAIENALKEQSKKEETKRLFISDFVEQFEKTETNEGYESIRFGAGELDYAALCAMTKLFVDGIGTDPRNDPNQMPTRYMILYGADDSKLKTIDKHPDSFEGQPEIKLNVATLRKALKLLGYDIKESGVFDDELYSAVLQYSSSIAVSSTGPTGAYEVKPNDTLGKIASTLSEARCQMHCRLSHAFS